MTDPTRRAGSARCYARVTSASNRLAQEGPFRADDNHEHCCLCEVRAGRHRATGTSRTTTPSTASASTACSPSSTSTPSSRRCRSRRSRGADDVEVTALTRRPRAGRRRGPQGAADGRRQGRPRRRRRDRRLRRDRHLAGARQGDREDRRRCDLVVCGMASTDGSMGVRPGDAGRAARRCPSVTLGSVVEVAGRPGPDQARRRHRHRGRSAARCRWCCR